MIVVQRDDCEIDALYWNDRARNSLAPVSGRNAVEGKIDDLQDRCAARRLRNRRAFWNGSLEETINLAREIGINCGADQFRVIECAGRGAEICSEEAPFLSKQRYCAQGAAS